MLAGGMLAVLFLQATFCVATPARSAIFAERHTDGSSSTKCKLFHIC